MPSNQAHPKISAIGLCFGQTLILRMPHYLAITLHFCLVMCAPSRVNQHITDQVR